MSELNTSASANAHDLSLRFGEQPQPANEVLQDDNAPTDKSTVAQPDPNAAAMAQILTIPGVQDLILAARRGERMSVVRQDDFEKLRNASATPVVDTPVEEPKWAEMSQEELARAIQSHITKKVTNEVAKIVQDSLDPITQNIKLLTDKANNYEQERTKDTVAEAIKRHPDLPKYRDQMSALLQSNPNLDIEDLYILAKSKLGHIDPQVTQVERPTHTTARPAQRLNADNKPTLGRSDFRNSLQQKLAAMDLSEFPAM